MRRQIRTVILALLILSMLVLTGAGSRPDIIEPSEKLYVTDDAGILSSETEQTIVDEVTALQQQCGGEIAVVTIDYLTDGLDSEEYAYEIMNQWGVGDSEKNNGVVLLLVSGEGKGWMTAGSGIEKSLTAGKIEQILNDELWDDFDAGAYDSAVLNTVDAVIQWYEDYYGISVSAESSAEDYASEEPYESDVEGQSNFRETAGRAVTIGVRKIMQYILVAVIVIILLASITRPRRRGGAHFFLFPRWHRRGPRPPYDPGPGPGAGFGPRPGGGFRMGGMPRSGGPRPGAGGGPGGSRPGNFGGGRGGFGGGGRSSGGRGSFGGGGGRGGGAGRR